ncbi:MAG: PaaI family thioesterase [Actinomycetales bacterium]
MSPLATLGRVQNGDPAHPSEPPLATGSTADTGPTGSTGPTGPTGGSVDVAVAATANATVTIPARFSGPPGSANGGYTAGLAAVALLGDDSCGGGQAVEVTLRVPPPLEQPLDVVRESDADGHQALQLRDGDRVVVEARVVDTDLAPVEPVSAEVARASEPGYRGLEGHPFPTCFACGTERARPDALALWPGEVAGSPGTTACTWRPDVSLAADDGCVRPEAVWAALDCPSGWTIDIVGRPAVLGRMTVQLDARPPVGEECVVVGRLLGREGRKAFTASTLYDADGRVLARATATWIEIKPAG